MWTRPTWSKAYRTLWKEPMCGATTPWSSSLTALELQTDLKRVITTRPAAGSQTHNLVQPVAQEGTYQLRQCATMICSVRWAEFHKRLQLSPKICWTHWRSVRALLIPLTTRKIRSSMVTSWEHQMSSLRIEALIQNADKPTSLWRKTPYHSNRGPLSSASSWETACRRELS